MSTTTTNYGLIKPERSDNYSVDVMAGNMNKIDSAMKAQDTRLTAVENEVNGNLVCNSVTADSITAGTITGNLTVKTVTVTPTTTSVYVFAQDTGNYVPLLPYNPLYKYSGSIKFKATQGNGSNTVGLKYIDSISDATIKTFSCTNCSSGKIYTLSFTNIDYLTFFNTTNSNIIGVCSFTLSV